MNRNTFPDFSLIHYSCSISYLEAAAGSSESSRAGVLICNCSGAAWPTLQITVSVIGDLLNYTSHRFYWLWNNKNYQITLLVKYWKLYICCPNTITFESYHTHSDQWSHDIFHCKPTLNLYLRTILDINKLHNFNIKSFMFPNGLLLAPIAHNQ